MLCDRQSGHYVNQKQMSKSVMFNKGDAQQKYFSLNTYSVSNITHPLVCFVLFFLPQQPFSSDTRLSIMKFNHIQSLLLYLSSHLVVCEWLDQIRLQPVWGYNLRLQLMWQTAAFTVTAPEVPTSSLSACRSLCPLSAQRWWMDGWMGGLLIK